MVQKIMGEAPFQVLATNFSISPSLQNYVLQISADGTNYSDLFTVSAGQTKMVTNVANGSYYRMKNNASEVSINWRTQCNDGQGGGGGSYILPPATEQTLGGIKVGSGLTVQADGTLSAEGGEGGDNTILKSVTEFPESADTGDVVALVSESEGLPLGITFEERNDLGENEDQVGGRFSFPVGAFDGIEEADALYVGKVTTPNDTELNLYVYGNEWRTGGAVFTDAGGNIFISMGPDSDNAGENPYDGAVFNYQYTSLQDEYMVVDIYPETSGEVVFDIPEASEEIGVYQYDGTNWNEIGGGEGGSDFIHLDSLSGTGETGKTYEYNQRLYKWVNGAGKWGRWITTPNNNSDGSGGSWDNMNSWLLYSYLPETSEEIELVRMYILGDYSLGYTSANGGELHFYNSNHIQTGQTPAFVIRQGDAETLCGTNSSRKIGILWTEGKIRFRCVSGWAYLRTESLYSTEVSTSHWEAYEVDLFRNQNNNGNGYGMPYWDSDGTIVGTMQGFNTKRIYFNTTGYSDSIKFFVNSSSWSGERVFVPTVGGTAGQILQSNGDNAAPTWTTMIKAQKITSAAYDALVQAGTTDPNTLYLIDDNV